MAPLLSCKNNAPPAASLMSASILCCVAWHSFTLRATSPKRKSGGGEFFFPFCSHKFASVCKPICLIAFNTKGSTNYLNYCESSNSLSSSALLLSGPLQQLLRENIVGSPFAWALIGIVGQDKFSAPSSMREASQKKQAGRQTDRQAGKQINYYCVA